LYELCRVLCQRTNSAGEHFERIDPIWFHHFITKTLPIHQSMWLDFMKPNTNTFGGYAMWQLVPRLKTEMMTDAFELCLINWIRNTQYHAHYPTIVLISMKYPYASHSDAYRTACTSV